MVGFYIVKGVLIVGVLEDLLFHHGMLAPSNKFYISLYSSFLESSDGYVSDDNLSVISQQHDYEDDRVYRRDGNDSTIEYTGEMEMILIILMMMMILKLKMKMLMKMMCKCQMNFCHCQNFLGFLVAQRL